MTSLSLQMTNTLLYPWLTASHEWSISLVSASSWFPWSLTSLLLVDLACVAQYNPSPAHIVVVDQYPLLRWSPSRTWRDRPCSHQMQWSCSIPVEVGHFVHRWPYELASSSPLALTLSVPWSIVARCSGQTLVVWHLKWRVTLFKNTSA